MTTTILRRGARACSRPAATHRPTRRRSRSGTPPGRTAWSCRAARAAARSGCRPRRSAWSASRSESSGSSCPAPAPSTATRSYATRCIPTLPSVVPYVSGVVELDGTQGAGARMLVNIIDCDPDAIEIGDRVRDRLRHVNEEMTHPTVPTRSETRGEVADGRQDLGQLGRLAPRRARRPVHDEPARRRWPSACRAASRTPTAPTRRSTSTARQFRRLPFRSAQILDDETAARSRAGARRQRHEAAARGPRPGGHLGRAGVPLDRDLDVVDPRSRAARRRVRVDQRLGVRVPAVLAPLRVHGDRSRSSTPSPPSPRSNAPPTSASTPRTSR